jgi:S-formylglutathione hydrolase FrmB
VSHSTPFTLRPARATLVIAFLALLAAFVPAAAGAAQRVDSFDLPSNGNVDLSATRLNKTTKLTANVLLPDGYDENPTKQWPVFYLLAGVGDNAGSWLDPAKGNVRKVAKDFPGIIVMPESGRGYFTDWWRGGTRKGSAWERYYLDEVVPQMEAKYRILPGRQNHAIGGISMGGYGAITFGAALPTYFGNLVSMSGLLDSQSNNTYYVLPADQGSKYERVFGPRYGPYATMRNPLKLVDNIAHSRAYISVGNGKISSRVPFNLAAWTTGSIAEQGARIQALGWSYAAKRAGVDVVYSGHTGVHDWPYWRAEFARLRTAGVFAPTPADDPTTVTDWTYRTMAPHGNMWGLGFKFAAPTTVVETFVRSGATLTATGQGTVTITPGATDADASGNGSNSACAFTAPLPFTHAFPAGC